jgi:uncharacterized membrane protein HdeD (DUF308 family)
MSPAARSIYYFSFYLYLTGVTLIAIPNTFLSVVKLPETNEVWIRVVGVLAVGIAYYYHRMSAENITAMFKHTVVARLFVFLCFSVFVIAKFASPVLLVFGVIDLLAAIWTLTALRKGE